MAVRVEIIKKKVGFSVGEKKSLTLSQAKDLEAQGVAKILGKVPTATDVLKKAEETNSKVDEILVNVNTIVAEKLEPIQALVNEFKSGNDKLIEDQKGINDKFVADIDKLTNDNKGLTDEINTLKSQLQKLKTANK